ncbi:MAG TPA: acetyl-CoA C-acetyltransferase, partial [Dehalococcoidia bacterium]|nr:acetyl-CoA C-acetyltransferase [Dehalococcoidia bacterium]
AVVDIGAVAARGALERSGVGADAIDEVILGHARQAGNGPNPARLAAIKAGIPADKPAFSVQQACIAGLKSVMLSAQSIALGEAEVVLAGGMEHHSSIPFLSPHTRWGARLGDVSLVDAMYKDGYICGVEGKHMGEMTDELAQRYGITREEQDRFALASQQRCDRARKEGFFAQTIVPVEIKQPRGAPVLFQEDEHPRPDTTLESLAKLPTAFRKEGTITAGNASGITDGACALVVMSRERAQARGLKPLGVIRSYAVAAVEPRDFALGPVPAVRKALAKAGLSLQDIDFIEINEAFAAMVLAVMRELDLDHAKVNVNGGAIALGHPTGMSGARILLELLYTLKARGGRFGMATLCGNGGHGGAMVVEAA